MPQHTHLRPFGAAYNFFNGDLLSGNDYKFAEILPKYYKSSIALLYLSYI